MRALAPEDKAGAFDEDEISAEELLSPKDADAKAKSVVLEGFIFRRDSFYLSPEDPDAEALSLLEGHCWKEVIELLEPRVNHAPNFTPWEVFYLALAHWAMTGRLRRDLCKRGVDKWLEQEAEKEFNALWILQGKLPG